MEQTSGQKTGSDAVQATKNLDALTAATERTETAAKRASVAWIDSIQLMVAQFERTAQTVESLSGRYTVLEQSATKAVAALDKVGAMAASATSGAGALNEALAASWVSAIALAEAGQGAAANIDGLRKSGDGAVGSLASLGKSLDLVASSARLLGTIKVVATDAAEYERAGLQMTAIGSSAGYTRGELANLQGELQKTGLSMTASRETVSQMVKANVDLSQAAQLARLAQDAATVGNISSTEALSRMVEGIQSAQGEVLRSIGLNVDFEASYNTFASALGRTTESLTEQERMQARVNATMAQAPAIAGLHEQSMSSLEEQTLSLTRYLNDLSVKVGEAFQPAYLLGVQTFAEMAKLAGENATLASVAVAAVTAAVGVLTIAMVASTSAAQAMGLAMVAAFNNPVVLAIAAVAAAVGALIALHGNAAAKARETGAAQESAAEVGLAGATKLEGRINSLIERYRQLGIESKRATSGAFTAAEFSAQSAEIESELQKLRAQQTAARNRLSNFPKTAEDLRGDRINGRPASKTYNELHGRQEPEVVNARFDEERNLDWLGARIRTLVSQKAKLEETFEAAVEKNFRDFVADPNRLTRADQMKAELEAEANKLAGVAATLTKGSDQHARAIAASEIARKNIIDRYKETPATPTPQSPVDYGTQIKVITDAAKLEAETIARLSKANDTEYSNGIKSAAAYYDEKSNLATRGAMEQVKAAEAQLTVVKDLIASGKGSLDDRKTLAGQEEKLTKDVSLAYLNLVSVQKDAADERAGYWTKFEKGWAVDAEQAATSAEAQANTLREQISQYGLTKSAIADLVAARARDDAAIAHTRLAMARARGDRAEDIAAIEREVVALDRRANALGETASNTHAIEQKETADKFAEEVKQRNEQIGNSLTDALMQGFEGGKNFGESFKNTLVNMFKTMVLRPSIQPIVQGAVNYVTGALGLNSGPTGGNSLGGSLNSANNMFGYLSAGMQAYGGYSTGASSASLMYANAVNTFGGDGIGALIAGNGGWAGVGVGSAISGGGTMAGAGGVVAGLGEAGGSALIAEGMAGGATLVGTTGAVSTAGAITGAGAVSGLGTAGGSALIAEGLAGGATYVGTTGAVAAASTAGGAAAGSLASTLGGAMSAISTAMPYIGLAIAAYTLLSGSFKGEKRVGGTYAADVEGGTGSAFMHGPSGGTAGKDLAVRNAIDATTLGINSTLAAIGSSSTLIGYHAAFEQSEKGRGGVMAGGNLSTGGAFGEDGAGSNYDGTYYEKFSTQSPDTDTAVKNLITDLKQSTIQALQAAVDVPQSIRSLIDGVDAEALSDDAVSALLDTINAQVAGVTAFRNLVDSVGEPFAHFKDMTYDLVAAFVEASGGADALQSNLTSYYETYYAESERMGGTLKSMTKTFDSLGFAVPATKKEFRELVDGLSLTDETAVKARATLLGMNQTFAGWADYADAQAAGARELDTAFGSLAATFPELAALSQKARGGLVEYSGGLDALQTNLSSYYQSYHSEAERMGDTLASVTATFAGLGLAVPTTREEFRALVESLDLTTGAGQKTYATLMGVGQSFGSVADHITAIVTAARDAAENAATDAMSALTRSVNTQKDALTKAWGDQQEAMQKGIDTASTAVNNLKSLSDQVKSTLNTMFGQTDAAMQRSQAQAQIVGALDKARAGGGLPERADLEAAFGIVAQPSADLFATFEDYQLDFLKTANDIAALGMLTNSQLSIEERTLAALKDQFDLAKDDYERQIDYYDEMLKSAQAQLDAALGNTQATLTVSQALTALTASLTPLGASKPPASTGGAPAALSATEQAIWNAYNSSGIGYLDAGGWSFWNDAVKNGASLTDITQQIIDINNGKNNAAINGSHALGLDYVPFDGYVAELHRGERIQTAAEARAADGMYSASMLGQVAAGNGSAELLAEVRALRQEVQGLRSEAQATAQHTAKTAKLATRWDVDGMPETREVATA